jgi:hypothetical protein
MPCMIAPTDSAARARLAGMLGNQTFATVGDTTATAQVAWWKFLHALTLRTDHRDASRPRGAHVHRHATSLRLAVCSSARCAADGSMSFLGALARYGSLLFIGALCSAGAVIRFGALLRLGALVFNGTLGALTWTRVHPRYRHANGTLALRTTLAAERRCGGAVLPLSAVA